MIKSFNYGMDFAGRPFKIEPKQIFPFAVVNAYAKNFGSLEKKNASKDTKWCCWGYYSTCF